MYVRLQWWGGDGRVYVRVKQQDGGDRDYVCMFVVSGWERPWDGDDYVRVGRRGDGDNRVYVLVSGRR